MRKAYWLSILGVCQASTADVPNVNIWHTTTKSRSRSHNFCRTDKNAKKKKIFFYSFLSHPFYFVVVVVVVVLLDDGDDDDGDNGGRS